MQLSASREKTYFTRIFLFFCFFSLSALIMGFILEHSNTVSSNSSGHEKKSLIKEWKDNKNHLSFSIHFTCYGPSIGTHLQNTQPMWILRPASEYYQIKTNIRTLKPVLLTRVLIFKIVAPHSDLEKKEPQISQRMLILNPPLMTIMPYMQTAWIRKRHQVTPCLIQTQGV